ncbi:Hsp20/alpha crystallin family protein [Thermodesulfobacteriota bacterium]
MMELVRLNPRRNMFSLQSRINRMFDDAVFPAAKDDEGVALCSWNPVVDIYEDDDNIMIKAELPGIDKKDIEVDVKDRVLTLKGERAYDNEVKEEKYYRRERAFGTFVRSFTLPAHVDSEKIKADFKDGVLHISVPKPEADKPHKISVH